MNYKQLLNPCFYFPNNSEYLNYFLADIDLFLHWSGKTNISKSDLSTIEFKYLKCLRKAQANKGNFWGHFYERKLSRMTNKTGIWIPATITCGAGMIIAHWGRIIVNPRTTIGNSFSISSGVVIGRDIRGKRNGVPTIGNNVVIKTNAAIIGNITIGDDVLIAPNAYVNFDVPSHSIVVGNPGRIIPRENATAGYI